MPTTTFSMRIDTDLKESLEKTAKSEDRSASYLASKAIKDYLARRARERAIIEKAIAEADKGHFVSSEAVDAWMQSWDTENELPMPKADLHFKN